MKKDELPDARLSVGLPGHPKTKKLIRRLGPAGGWFLVRLILWTRQSCPDGDLTGKSVEDIELAVDWDGADGEFVRALVEVRFLEGAEGSYRMHDWADHQPWAMGAGARSEKSRWAALIKQHGRPHATREMPEYAARLAAELAAGSGKGASAVPVAPVGSASGTPVASDTDVTGMPPAEVEHATGTNGQCPVSVTVSVSDTVSKIKSFGNHPPGELVTPPPAEPRKGEGDAPPQPPIPPTLAGEACRLMRDAGCISTNPSHQDLLDALAEGVTPQTLADTAREAIDDGKRKPFAWAIEVARSRHAERRPAPSVGARDSPGAKSQTKQERLEASNRAVGDDWAQRKMAEMGATA